MSAPPSSKFWIRTNAALLALLAIALVWIGLPQSELPLEPNRAMPPTLVAGAGADPRLEALDSDTSFEISRESEAVFRKKGPRVAVESVDADTVLVHGVVLSEAGAGVPCATVTFATEGVSLVACTRPFPAFDENRLSSLTDAQGRFRLAVPRDPRICLVAYASGFQPDRSDFFRVGRDDQQPSITIRLLPGTIWRGRVFDRIHGSGLGAVSVIAEVRSLPVVARSNADGVFELDGMPANRKRLPVRLQAEGPTLDHEWMSLREVPDWIEFPVEPVAPIQIEVRSQSTGQRISGTVYAIFARSTPGDYGRRFRGRSGWIQAQRPMQPRVWLHVSSAGYCSARIETFDTALDSPLVVELRDPERVEVVVTDPDGNPVPNAVVETTDDGDTSPYLNSLTQGGAPTNAGGEATIRNYETDLFRVRVQPPAGSKLSHTSVGPFGQEATWIHVRLQHRPSIRGHVTIPTGSPGDWAVVLLSDGIGVDASVKLDSRHEFVFEDLDEGDYLVRAVHVGADPKWRSSAWSAAFAHGRAEDGSLDFSVRAVTGESSFVEAVIIPVDFDPAEAPRAEPRPHQTSVN